MLPSVAGVHLYKIFVAGAFVVAITLAVRRGPREGFSSETVRDLCFWMLVAALVGSRALYVITNPGEFSGPGAVGRAFALWRGGLVFYGGLLLAVATAIGYARLRRFSFLAAADLLAPYLALGHAIGRLGCLSAGCCFGRPSPHGFAFPPGSIAFQDLVARHLLDEHAGATPPLHPTQLYDALAEFALFALLVALRRRRHLRGQLFALWLGAYAIARFAIEILRGDVARRYVAHLPSALDRWVGAAPDAPALLSTSQGIAIALFACALLVALVARRLDQSGGGSSSTSAPSPVAST